MHSLPARIPLSPPEIVPVASGVTRPLWSVMIPTYNCTTYLQEALRSILLQAPGPDQMQIEVVDDASTDADVAQVVATVGAGRVAYFRQPVNVGSLRNFETCLNRARGQLVHLLHGDDRVCPGFYEKLGGLFQRYPAVGAAFSNYATIDANGQRLHVQPPVDEEGLLGNWLIRIAERQRIQYAAIVVRREVYERLGSFYGTSYGEDWEMWVRVARYYPVAYTPAVLAEYRGHTASISAQKIRLSHVIPDLLYIISRIEQHLPVEERKRIAALSRRYYARLGVGVAYQLLRETDDWPLAQSQMRQALSMSRHPSIYYHLLKFYSKLVLYQCGLHR